MNVEILFDVPARFSPAAVDSEEMQMNPTLTKMLADQRMHEITTRASRVVAVEPSVPRREGVFARWASMVRANLAHPSGTSRSAINTHCCPAT